MLQLSEIYDIILICKGHKKLIKKSILKATIDKQIKILEEEIYKINEIGREKIEKGWITYLGKEEGWK